MDTYKTEEPVYIDESEEIMLLKKYYTYEELKIQKGHHSLVFVLLINTLFLMYDNTNFSHLVSRAHIHNESKLFSLAMLRSMSLDSHCLSGHTAAGLPPKSLLVKASI